jgi:MFS family permease
MPEVILVLCIVGLVFSPQILAGILARSMGRNFWAWFGISFILPFISIFILVFLKDKKPVNKSYRLADHVKKREPVN